VIEDGILGAQAMLDLDVSGFGGCPVLLDRPPLLKVGGHPGSFLLEELLVEGRRVHERHRQVSHAQGGHAATPWRLSFSIKSHLGQRGVLRAQALRARSTRCQSVASLEQNSKHEGPLNKDSSGGWVLMVVNLNPPTRSCTDLTPLAFILSPPVVARRIRRHPCLRRRGVSSHRAACLER